MNTLTRRSALALVSLAGLLSACGGGGDKPAAREDAQGRPTYSVGGTITGVVPPTPFGVDTILMTLNGGFTEPFSATSGTFTFSRELLRGETYSVAVGGTVAGYSCSVTSGGSGTIERADITDVVVTCVEIPRYPVPVSVTGLPRSTSVVIQNNGSANQVTASADGTYTFPVLQSAGTGYGVTVVTQPAKGSCSVPQPVGTVQPDMAPIAVVCGPGN